MSTYRIESRAGVVMGDYEGDTPEEAFAAMVADAGDGEDTEGRSTAGTAADWIIREVSETTYRVVRVAEDGHAGEYVPGGESDGDVIASGLTYEEACAMADRGHGHYVYQGERIYYDSPDEGCGGYAVEQE